MLGGCRKALTPLALRYRLYRGLFTPQSSSAQNTNLLLSLNNLKAKCSTQPPSLSLQVNWNMRTSSFSTLTPSQKSRVREIEISQHALNTTKLDNLDVICVPVTTEDLNSSIPRVNESIVEVLNTFIGGDLAKLIQTSNFKAANGEILKTKVNVCDRWVTMLLIGCDREGESTSYDAALWGRTIGENVAQEDKSIGFVSSGNIDMSLTEALLKNILTHGHVDTRFKQEPKSSSLKRIKLISSSPWPDVDFQQITQKSKALAEGAILCSELVNAPANILTPESLAETAVDIAKRSEGSMEAKVLEKEECEALGMGAYLAVSSASVIPPKFIHLKYKSSQSSNPKRKIAVVGKGLTFDSGGYNIKTGAGCLIELMKFDMGGAASVLGCAKTISMLKPDDVEVHFIVAACENMISGSGMRPGDILVASNGLTIEVNNTDAEGRLTLADALVYAGNLGVTEIVDVATLTGACIVALGEDISGLFTPSDSLASSIENAARNSGEFVHRLPLHQEYWVQMKSNLADMKNTGKGPGGSITAALFLNKFVKEGIDWAHLDIAGPVWDAKKEKGTGFGVSTLAEWILRSDQT